MKHAIESACQHSQEVQIRIDCCADRLARHPFHRRHFWVVGIGHHHARIQKLKTGAGSSQRIDGLGHIGHRLVRIVDCDCQGSRDGAVPAEFEAVTV